MTLGDDEVPLIYGLEFQARALAPQLAETDVVRFMIGTQSLKMANNQIHVVELNEETGALYSQVHLHDVGEIWDLNASPGDPGLLATCYNALRVPEGDCVMRSALWRLPESRPDELQPLQLVCPLETGSHGDQVKTTTFHPVEVNQAATIVDNKFLVWDLGQAEVKLITVGVMEGKGHQRFTTGKWNPQMSGGQLATASDTCLKGWDVRTPKKQAWTIDAAHSQLVRDFDFNPNRQHYVGSCGDDACCKLWDLRHPTQPVISRCDHSHWVWCLRYNQFHDQLIVSSSSDGIVLLTSVASIASAEPLQEEEWPRMEDGVLARCDLHQDSVYCVEWSSADPWTFASLSYDGRLLINKVPKHIKYKILL